MTDFVPKRKKLLTRPQFKFEKGVPRYLKFETKMALGKDLKEKEGAKKKEPATVCDVVDLATSELGMIIVNAVVKSVLHDSYPDDSYVGKCFMITKQARQEGKTYDPFSVEEIEDPTAVLETDAAHEEKQAAAAHGGKRR